MSTAINVSFKPKEGYRSINKSQWIVSFIRALKHLDIAALESIMPDDIVTCRDNKWGFLAYVKGRLDYMKEEGETELLLEMDVCGLCKRNHPAHIFIGKNTKRWISFVLEMDTAGYIKEIMICNGPGVV